MKRTPLKPGNKPLKRTGFKRKPPVLKTKEAHAKPRKNSFSKKKSKKINYRDKADGLWQLLMWYMWNGKCAMCGRSLKFDEFTGEREGAGHHLIGRAVYHLRHDPNNGILFCNHCHNFADDAPHNSLEMFTAWLLNFFPAVAAWVEENIGVEGTEPDYQEVCRNLEVLIIEAKGGI